MCSKSCFRSNSESPANSSAFSVASRVLVITSSATRRRRHGRGQRRALEMRRQIGAQHAQHPRNRLLRRLEHIETWKARQAADAAR